MPPTLPLARLRQSLLDGQVIPAHPLALTAQRRLDETRQIRLTHYYSQAGAGGIAVGVHTTQFAIREHSLLEPVLRLARENWPADRIAIAGVCGETPQAMSESSLAAELGYDAVLLNLSALAGQTNTALLEHCKAVAQVLPLVGFYLQPSIGGMNLDYNFWRGFCDIPQTAAIKVAPFDRYRTLDVLRAVADSGRSSEIALYTGNDDNILLDLLTPFRFGEVTLHFHGGLLGQWAVWTKAAVALLEQVKQLRATANAVPSSMLTLAAQLTDANGAIFDVKNQFHGCIAGIHEVLRRDGLLDGTWCLDPNESLGPGQIEEIDRVMAAYPHLR